MVFIHCRWLLPTDKMQITALALATYPVKNGAKANTKQISFRWLMPTAIEKANRFTNRNYSAGLTI